MTTPSTKMTVAIPTHMLSKLSSFYFFYYATIGAFLPFWSLYLEESGFNKAQIGWLMAVTMVARIFAPSVWGHLADKSGKRMFLIRIATVAELFAWLAIFVFPANFYSFFAIMLFFSFFQNAIIPQFEAVTLFWLGEKRDNYGNVRLWGSVGFIVTVFGLGLVFDFVSLSLLPLVLAVLAFICFVNAMIIQEPRIIDNENNSEENNGDAKNKENALATNKSHTNINSPDKTQRISRVREYSYFERLRTKPVALFFLAQFVLLLSHAPFYSFYSNYLAEFGYSKSSIGFLWSVGVIAEIILFTQSKSILLRFSRQRLIVFCIVITGVRWLMVALFPSSFILQFFAQCIHAFSFALFQSIAMQLIYQEFSQYQQGRAQAFYSTCWGFGVAIGSVVVGNFWDSTGGEFWFAFAGVMLLIFGVLLSLVNKMDVTANSV